MFNKGLIFVVDSSDRKRIFESRDLSWDESNVNEDDDNFLTFEKMITPDGEL